MHFFHGCFASSGGACCVELHCSSSWNSTAAVKCSGVWIFMCLARRCLRLSLSSTPHTTLRIVSGRDEGFAFSSLSVSLRNDYLWDLLSLPVSTVNFHFTSYSIKEETFAEGFLSRMNSDSVIAWCWLVECVVSRGEVFVLLEWRARLS